MDKRQKRTGVEIISEFVEKLNSSAGVYRMYDKSGAVLYVGKAKNLKKRVTNYTKPENNSLRIQRMIFNTAYMEATTTSSEHEALLLEASLIKKLKPRYNILMRDDKSFPYIVIKKNHKFPVVTKHRGAKEKDCEYFGPFANASAVNSTLEIVQKIFMLRNCSDNVFKSRTRPCMQYQIKRCTAPCVNKVSESQYAKQVEMAKNFLTGNDTNIKQQLAEQMQKASDNLEYEEAAILRDRINSLTKIQSYKKSNFSGDIFAIYNEYGVSCIQVFFFTQGQNFGNKAYFPKHDKEDSNEDILSAFITQFYSERPAPKEILINIDISEKKIIEKALSAKINKPTKSIKAELVINAEKNAKEALNRKQAEETDTAEIFSQIKDAFKLKEIPNRIEVYDNSHISGKHALGAMIVVTPEGFKKSAYRKYNMDSSHNGDDYSMMYEMIYRRLSKLAEDNKPDLLLIDGGLGQLNSTLKAMSDLKVEFPVVAIAKGEDRNAGREKFFLPHKKEPIEFDFNSPLLYFMQRIRDESHRFVITSHRNKRSKAISENPLDNISGIGKIRKKSLLTYFGSAKSVADASIGDLMKVEGINKEIAESIYYYFHEEQ